VLKCIRLIGIPKGFGSTPPSPRETPSYSGMVRAEISYPINIHKLNKAANNSIFLNHNRYIAKTKIKKYEATSQTK
jgi:hypothetical protein